MIHSLKANAYKVRLIDETNLDEVLKIYKETKIVA